MTAHRHPQPWPTRHPRTTRQHWTARLCLATVATLSLVTNTGVTAQGSPASSGGAPASGLPSEPVPALASEADHQAGSQIAKHEGITGEPPAPTDRTPKERVHGVDVSSHQGNVNWSSMAAKGVGFAYVKATEGTGYKNPYFVQQYEGSFYAGLVHGAYHFALPDRSDGASQADYFVDHGGGWSPDGRTLPPALDIEYNPYGDICYGLDDEEMADWIREFSDEVYERTGRWPTIYTSTNWWNQCVGTSGRFGSTNPLWIARYASSVGALPFDWGFHTIWQYANAGAVPGDQNYFNGSYERLIALANG